MEKHRLEWLQSENELLKRRIAELEHTLEVQEWGAQLFHESEIPQLLLDLETGAVFAANAAARRFYGEQIIQQGHIDCICAEGMRWQRDLRALVEKNQYGVRVSRQNVYANEVRIVEAHYTLVRLRRRPVVHLICFDITDRVRAQQELELSHSRYQAFIQLSSEAIWRNMMTGPIPVQLPVEEQIDLIFERSYLAECNLAYCREWGVHRPDELTGTFMRERVSPENPLNREMICQFILNGYRLSNWIRTENLHGKDICHLCSYQGIVDNGYLYGMWGVFRDITELIRTQRALEASEARYRHFVEHANEAIWRLDMREPIDIRLPVEQQIEQIFARAYLAECNRAYARKFGHETPELLVGASLSALLDATDEKILALVRTLAEHNYRIEGLVSVEKLPGSAERVFLNSITGVIENGKLIRLWGVQTDITEMRRLQQELDRAYRLESIGRLAGGIAHDFNNVLTAVMGYAELARGRVQDETVQRYLEGIQTASARAADLNKQLLAYARRQVIQPAPMNLGQWLEGTKDILSRVLPENIRLRTHPTTDLWQVSADPNLLLQIVLNLVVNARDAMPGGGTITLRLSNKTLRRTRAHSIPNGRYVLLEVEDTGTGIPPEVLPHIFEPFYTTKPMGQGTGMGLAAVQGAVQQLGGHIEVRTEVGKGTCFSVYFPRLEPPRPPRRTP